MDSRQPQNSSCCSCCQCTSQACSAYLIGILASILIISGVFLAFHRWDYAWLIISLIGTILMFIGSVLYFCMSNNDQRRQTSAAKQSSNTHHVSPSAPTLDQSRSISQLSLNMLPPYFPAFDTVSMTSHLASSTTASVHATVSQILNINGQAFLMLPLTTTEVPSQDNHSVGTKTSTSETTQISINPIGTSGQKSPVENRNPNQPGNRESICAVTPLFVTLPPVKKEPPLPNMSPDVLLLTDAMLGRGSLDSRKATDGTDTQVASQSHQASIGIQVETLPTPALNKETTNESTSTTGSIPQAQEVSITMNSTVLLNDGQLPSVCQDSNLEGNNQEVERATSSESSLQLSNDSLAEGTVTSECMETAPSTTECAITASPADPQNLACDSGIGDTDERETATDADNSSEIADDSCMTTPLVQGSVLETRDEYQEVATSLDTVQDYDILPRDDPGYTNNESETRGPIVEGGISVFPSTSVEGGTDNEPLLPAASSQHSLCDTDDETYFEGSSSPPPSYEEVARDSNHSIANYGTAYDTM